MKILMLFVYETSNVQGDSRMAQEQASRIEATLSLVAPSSKSLNFHSALRPSCTKEKKKKNLHS